VIGEQAAQERAGNRRKRIRTAGNADPLATFPWWEEITDNGDGNRFESTCADALKRTESSAISSLICCLPNFIPH
jgi:hypothetical protein